jgi:hypothetical protein
LYVPGLRSGKHLRFPMGHAAPSGESMLDYTLWEAMSRTRKKNTKYVYCLNYLHNRVDFSQGGTEWGRYDLAQLDSP